MPRAVSYTHLDVYKRQLPDGVDGLTEVEGRSPPDSGRGRVDVPGLVVVPGRVEVSGRVEVLGLSLIHI